jgi:hypothetical protein
MKIQSTCKIPVLLTDVKKRDWSVVDKETGRTRVGTVNTLCGVIIPENPNQDPSLLKEIEFNIYDNNPDIIGTAELSKTFYRNEQKFAEGNVYAIVETYMAPKYNNNGLVTFFSPYVNGIQVLTPSDEDRPNVIAATRRKEQL